MILLRFNNVRRLGFPRIFIVSGPDDPGPQEVPEVVSVTLLPGGFCRIAAHHLPLVIDDQGAVVLESFEDGYFVAVDS